MGRAKKYSAEQIVNLLRQIEVGIANGKTHPVACREAGHRDHRSQRALNVFSVGLDLPGMIFPPLHRRREHR
jgi:hypothetical protein